MQEARAKSKKSINLKNTVLLAKAVQEGAASNLMVQFIWLFNVLCPRFLHFLEALDLCFCLLMPILQA